MKNGIHYCFIEDFGEMVFAVNPETAEENYVRPLAENSDEFISLILACGGKFRRFSLPAEK